MPRTIRGYDAFGEQPKKPQPDSEMNKRLRKAASPKLDAEERELLGLKKPKKDKQ